MYVPKESSFPRIEKSEFCRSIRPRVRQVDWRQGVASDKELMDRATGKMMGTGGSAVSSMLGQALVRGVGPGVRC